MCCAHHAHHANQTDATGELPSIFIHKPKHAHHVSSVGIESDNRSPSVTDKFIPAQSRKSFEESTHKPSVEEY
jgi:hypothetical protein